MAKLPETQFTELLAAWRGGERAAADQLFALVYDELRVLAHYQVRSSRPGDTLNTTALVHETYLKLTRSAGPADRHHFYALAAKAMRQILVDSARERATEKRGAGLEIMALDGQEPADLGAVEVLALNDALDELSRLDERLGRTVELRFFGGLSIEATAEAMDTSPATVKRDWSAARAFLIDALNPGAAS